MRAGSNRSSTNNVSSIHHKFSERRDLESFPFPIAYMFAHRIVNCTDDERKVSGIVDTFGFYPLLLKFLNYCAFSELMEGDETVGEGILLMLKNKIDFVQMNVDALQRQLRTSRGAWSLWKMVWLRPKGAASEPGRKTDYQPDSGFVT